MKISSIFVAFLENMNFNDSVQHISFFLRHIQDLETIGKIWKDFNKVLSQNFCDANTNVPKQLVYFLIKPPHPHPLPPKK